MWVEDKWNSKLASHRSTAVFTARSSFRHLWKLRGARQRNWPQDIYGNYWDENVSSGVLRSSPKYFFTAIAVTITSQLSKAGWKFTGSSSMTSGHTCRFKWDFWLWMGKVDLIHPIKQFPYKNQMSWWCNYAYRCFQTLHCEIRASEDLKGLEELLLTSNFRSAKLCEFKCHGCEGCTDMVKSQWNEFY